MTDTETIAALRAENARLRELLREHEWCDWSWVLGNVCPSCGGLEEEDGHKTACPLAAALKGGKQ